MPKKELNIDEFVQGLDNTLSFLKNFDYSTLSKDERNEMLEWVEEMIKKIEEMKK